MKVSRLTAGILIPSLLVAGLYLGGCSGKSPDPTPAPATASPAATDTPQATATATPSDVASASPASTESPDATASPEESIDPEYRKLKESGINLALGRGYEEAIPELKKALEAKPDDAEVQFYMMLSLGMLEDEPTPKSEAYAHAKRVIELAPNTPMADRARDYVISAESEPKKELPNLPVEPLAASNGYDLSDKGKNAVPVITLGSQAVLFKDDHNVLTPEVKKQLWYMTVVPDSVTEKLALDKGVQLSIQDAQDFMFSKNSWRGGPDPSKAGLDTNSYNLAAFYVEVESGDNKGTKGWVVNQMDRVLGEDENGEAVFGVKFGPVIPLPRAGVR